MANLEIRRGDIWEYTTNNGVIMRHVRSVACGIVSYVCDGKFMQCKLSTFKVWAKGSELTSAEDWKGR